MKNRISEICVLLAGILWGCIGILQRTMNEAGFAAMEIVTVRSVVTSVCMVVFLLLYNRKLLQIKLKDVWCFIGTGMLSIVFFNFCYLSCMQYTTLSVAAILLYTAPSFVMVMSFFLFKEKFTGLKVLALILSFAGCVLVSGGIGSSDIGVKGILYGLGAGFGYALYSIFGKYAIKKGYGSYTITAYTFLFSTLGCMLFSKPSAIWLKMSGQAPSKIVLELLLIIAVSVCAYILYTQGLAGLENGKSALLASIEPVVATLVSLLIYKEGMGMMVGVGIVLVLASIIIVDIK